MSGIAGKRIMLLEDEAIIAFAVEDMLADMGCIVVGPALRLDEACDLARDAKIDAAVLDVNINSERSYPVAEELRRRNVPFVFATGYDREGVEWNGEAEVISKPYRREQLRAALERILG
jgi:CheY-like chemotaxis protein